MSRLSYLLRRLLLAIPTFLAITLICFALTRILPGGPVEMRFMRLRAIGSGGEGAPSQGVALITREQRDELNRQFGFDRPFLEQYSKWLFKERMGLRLASYDYPERTAGNLILSRIPVSLWFGITGFILAYAISIPLGLLKAIRHGSNFDLATSALVFAGYAIPPFALAMMLKLLFTGVLDGYPALFPLGGFESSAPGASLACRIMDRARHMFLPVCCYVAGSFALLALMVKNSLLEQISADYARTATAKGASPMYVLWRHVLRNALIPVATGFGSVFSVFFAGSVIIEQIFEIPGMGRLSLDALAGRDYAVFMAILAIASCMQLLGNLLSDVCYMLIDPRIDFGRK